MVYVNSTALAGLTGWEIQDIAWSQGTVPLGTLGKVTTAITYIFLLLTTIVVGLRIYVRTKLPEAGQKWRIDDYLAIVGWVLFIPSSILAVICCYYGMGVPSKNIDPEREPFLTIKAYELMICFEFIYFGSSCVTKASIAFMVLRLCERQSFIRTVFIGNMVLMGVSAVAIVIFVFGNCIPFAGTWNPHLNACRFKDGWIIVSYIGSGIQAWTDWVSAIMPYFVVHNLQMPRSRKIAIVMILGLGVFASLAALIRVAWYKYYDTEAYPGQYLYHSIFVILLSILECGLGIIACSLPTLRKLFKGLFERSTGAGGSTDRLGTNLRRLAPSANKPTSGVHDSGLGQWDRLRTTDSDRAPNGREGIVKSTEFQVHEATIDIGQDRINNSTADSRNAWGQSYDGRS